MGRHAGAAPAAPADAGASAESGSRAGRRPGAVRHFLPWLVGLSVVGLAVRVGYIWIEQDQPLNGDGIHYYAQALGLSAGKGFINPFTGQNDALHPPAWPLLLSITGHLGRPALFDFQVLAALVGATAVPLVGLAGRKLAGARAGLIAAGIAAIYPGLWRYERALLSESLLMPLIALTILLAYRFRERPGLARAVGLGLMCGLLASTRSEQILIAPLVVAPLVWWAREPVGRSRIPWRRRVGWLAAAAAVTVAVLAPWFVYNLGRFDSPVLLSNGFSGATTVSTCDAGFYGPRTGYYDLNCLFGHRTTSAKLDYLTDHLGRLPVVVAAREGRTLGLYSPFQQVRFDQFFERSDLGVHLAALFGFWLLLVPSVVGAVVLRRRHVPIYPLLGFAAAVAITVAVTFGEPRYRAPAEIPALLLAAVAVDAAIRWWRDPTPVPAVAAPLATTEPSRDLPTSTPTSHPTSGRTPALVFPDPSTSEDPS